MRSFDRRSETLELMDDPSIDGDELVRTLDELETINRALGGYAPSLAGIAQLIPASARELSVLDVGTGGGDFPRRLLRWAAKRDLRVRIEGIDLSPTTIRHAAAQTGTEDSIRFAVRDLFDVPGREQYDIVHCALLLHHCVGDDAGRALRRMHELSRLGVVVNDLHRHPLAYYSIRLLTRILSRSRLIRNDAPLSVLRAFRREELRRLVGDEGLPAPRIRWHWAFRWRMVVPK